MVFVEQSNSNKGIDNKRVNQLYIFLFKSVDYSIWFLISTGL